MFNKAQYKAIGLVGLLTLIVVFCLPKHTAAQIKLAFGGLFLPLFGLSRTGSNLADAAGNAVIPRSEIVAQNEQLRHANQLLQMQAMQTAAIQHENDQLRQQVSWQSHSQWRDKLRLAKVIARDPANWWQTIQIDLGTRDGVQEDLPVMTDAGLVGRVSTVSLTRSQVVLISSSACKVSAIIDDKSAETGVITGSAGPINTSLVNLSYLSSTSNLKPGQTVKTSGLGGFFPKGITIGQIAEDSHTVEFGLLTEARVKLSVNLGALEEVWVLMR